MSILVPVVSTGITLNEIPDKVAFFIELGSCTQRCKGCHSKELWEEVKEPTSLDALITKAEQTIDKGANAIVLMGGTCNRLSIENLLVILQSLSEIAPTCLYSGSDDESLNRYVAEKTDITWIKTGSYKEELGGLSSPTTNQRFFRKEYEYRIEHCTYPTITSVLVDCTHLFRK